MDPTYSHIVSDASGFDGSVEALTKPMHTNRMSRQSKLRPEETREICLRMKAVRRWTGLSQDKFAKQYGLGKSQWTQIEGGNRIGVDAAITLVREMRLTLDWIYLGDPARMPGDTLAELRKKIIEIRAEDEAN
jgi:DNA-binding transcriptional regulator YiaG